MSIMRIFIFLLVGVYLLMVAYGVAIASEQDDPIALQTSQWMIEGIEGNSQVGVNPDACTMTVDYDNGFRLSFKAKGERLTALRINAVEASNHVLEIKGFVGFGVGKNSYALQSKHHDGQIDATLLTVPNVAEKMMDATVIRLKLGVKNYYLALQGFSDGYQRLMVCMGIRPTKTLMVVNEESKVPGVNVAHAPRAPKTEMPAEPIDIVMAEDLTAPEMDDQGTLTPTPIIAEDAFVAESDDVIDAVDEAESVEVAHAEPVDVAEPEVETPNLPQWRAMKGEKLSDVLRKWAEIQGVQTHIVLDNDPILSKDIVSNGSFEVAVNVVLKETGIGGAGPTAIVKNADGRVTHVAGYQGGTLARQVGRSASVNNRWRALVGTDLRKVLMRWSVENNVDFVWDAPETYLIRQSIKTTAGYDQAVSMLLRQFEGQSIRPVAQLNTDPETGRKSLTVTTHHSAS